MEIKQSYQLPIKRTTINVVWDKEVDYVLMIQKRRNMQGFGDKVGKVGLGKFNFTGGKLEPGENFLQGVTRETLEETGLKIVQTMPKGYLNFAWPDVNIQSMVYLTTEWEGEPIEGTEEASVMWVPRSKIPFDRMFNTDRTWVPQAFQKPFFFHHIVGKLKDKDIVNEIEMSKRYHNLKAFQRSVIGRQLLNEK